MINGLGLKSLESILHVATKPATPTQSESFASFFSDALAQTEQLQKTANEKTQAFLKGESTDLHNVAMAVQAAELHFEFVQQIRNKMVQAYQEVMRTQL